MNTQFWILSYPQWTFFDEGIHITSPLLNSFERFGFLRDLQLSMSINVLKYNPGGTVGSTCFIWKVPDKLTVNEVMHDTMRIIKDLTPRLPEYHTRRMKKDFISRYSNLRSVSIPKHILWSIYADFYRSEPNIRCSGKAISYFRRCRSGAWSLSPK